MDNEIPEWLDKEFIKKALEGKESSETIQVESIEVDKPIPKGDNYLCDIFRVKTSYKKAGKSSTISLFVKSPIIGGVVDNFAKMGAFRKEFDIYYEYLPKIDRLSGKKSTPESYYSSKQDIIVLEDLKSKGYAMIDRRHQLDYDHSVAVLKKLAAFHATSVKMHEMEPELVENLGKELILTEIHKDLNMEFIKHFFQLLAQKCRETPELVQYADKLNEYAETFWDTLVELLKPKKNSFNVLNHGDIWVNNILFLYENGKPIDSKFIDLQLSRYTWPSIDLLQFFYSSIQEHVRETRRDELFSVYLTELNLNLEHIGLPQRLTKTELNEMIKNSEFFAIFVSLYLFPFVVADPKDVVDLGDLTPESLADIHKSPLKRNFNGKMYLKIIPKRLQEFAKNGWF